MSIIDQAAKRLEQLQGTREAAPTEVRAAGGSVRAASDLILIESVRRLEPVPEKRVEPSPPAPIRDQPKPAPSVTLDLQALEQAGYLIPDQTRTQLAEEFRRLKRPLLEQWRKTGGSGTIMITSAVPREGKTFFSLNLAMSLAAEIDLHVLLVDADVVHPEAMRRLGVSQSRSGLLDLVSDDSLSIDDVVLQTNVPKLELLPAGTQSASSTELLASESMRKIMDALVSRRANQIVVFDGPPLLATNEAQVLASRVGQVVMVVAAAQTPRALVLQALESIDQCEVVTTVLNKSDKPAVPSGYGYY